MDNILKTSQILNTERECVLRQEDHECDRDCESCDLCLPTKDVIEAYNRNSEYLHKLSKIKSVYGMDCSAHAKLDIIHDILIGEDEE